jgi:hypothetical protein
VHACTATAATLLLALPPPLLLLQDEGSDEEDDDEGKDKVGSLFRKAKAIGAQQGTADDLPPQAGGAFAGQGRTLAGQVRGGRGHVVATCARPA